MEGSECGLPALSSNSQFELCLARREGSVQTHFLELGAQDARDSWELRLHTREMKLPPLPPAPSQLSRLTLLPRNELEPLGTLLPFQGAHGLMFPGVG